MSTAFDGGPFSRMCASPWGKITMSPALRLDAFAVQQPRRGLPFREEVINDHVACTGARYGTTIRDGGEQTLHGEENSPW